MHYGTTVSCFKSLIILENFFCINRSYLLSNTFLRLICNVINYVMILGTAAASIYDFTLPKTILGWAMDIILMSELVYLAAASARKKKTFKALARLDEKYGTCREFATVITAEVKKSTLIILATVVIDATGMYFLGMNTLNICIQCVLLAAHDSEEAFLYLLITAINKRLRSLQGKSPGYSSRVYRHILVTTSYINYEYNFQILYMLAVTLLTTIIYAMIIMLVDVNVRTPIMIYLSWRELKSLHSLWCVCASASDTSAICEEIMQHLARQIIACDDNRTPQYKLNKRLLACMGRGRPQFVHEAVVAVDRAIPLQLLDLAVNYLLILIQMYWAYL